MVERPALQLSSLPFLPLRSERHNVSQSSNAFIQGRWNISALLSNIFLGADGVFLKNDVCLPKVTCSAQIVYRTYTHRRRRR